MSSYINISKLLQVLLQQYDNYLVHNLSKIYKLKFILNIFLFG